MGSPNTCKVALKEWAVTLLSFDRGEQIVLLRKGGISEESKEFHVIHNEFLLYPTFQHQREELLKPAYRANLCQVGAHPFDPNFITFTHWARVEEVIEVTEQRKIDHLDPYHIWTNDYAQQRLHWKPKKSLCVLLLRVFRMDDSQTVPNRSEYDGCKSWVTLESAVSIGKLKPVLSLNIFRRKVAEVRNSLGLLSGFGKQSDKHHIA